MEGAAKACMECSCPYYTGYKMNYMNGHYKNEFQI